MSTSSARSLIASLVLSVAALAPAQAATVPFSDNFDGTSGTQLNTPPSGWTVIGGTVDWLKDNTFSIRCYGNTGGCVDLDGSTGSAGLMSTGDFLLQAGVSYALLARVSGNQRNDDTESLTFGFLDATDSSVLSSQLVSNILGGDTNNTFNLISLVFTPTTTVSARIFFDAAGGNNIGPILDNVSLTAVPLPAAAWLLLSGLVGFAALGRRRAAG